MFLKMYYTVQVEKEYIHDAGKIFFCFLNGVVSIFDMGFDNLRSITIDTDI